MSLALFGFHIERDGYGCGVRNMARELRRIDSGVEIVDMAVAGTYVDPQERTWTRPGRAVMVCLPLWYGDVTAAGGLAGVTMFEATRLPAGWAEMINRYCTRVLVPCAWNVDVFEASGVHVPISLMPWGINPDEYFYTERPSTALRFAEDAPYTLVWSGTPDLRKGWDMAYRAFRLAFGDRDDVQLVLHFREALPGQPRFRDRNVRAVIGRLDDYAWRALLASADVCVYPARGEGWGLPPREAAATGLPVIATNFGGLAQDIEAWALPLDVRRLVTAEYGYFDAGTIGEWAEPDIDHLVELMRWCESNREAALEVGRGAAEWLRRRGTWECTAQKLLSEIDG